MKISIKNILLLFLAICLLVIVFYLLILLFFPGSGGPGKGGYPTHIIKDLNKFI